ncbi:hypothetical protein WA1_02480 [Scytonema hofmannii PCC 7110]|uniref:Uncharacterized protein n=1 Tax=Scytonema hofmannii PCC 7110 TaxID=128403 RepID=A0A139XH89_9CYAN|nr:hypothetical protein [Scytonema hofmannii]KYC44029.1 hypothetical protein WA1_02480 [Scytonema hofmannii PCC 7110]
MTSNLFKWACKGLKYFLWTLLGFAIAYVISQVFGAAAVQILLFSILLPWLSRIAIFIFCLFVVAIVDESCR